MAINRNGQATKYKFLHNGRMLKKGFHNSTTLIWSAGSTVTYKVDTGVEYTEEVDSDATCLSPKTFTPTKSGWTFVGWRENTTASNNVLSSKVMGSDPITLYAVFKQNITVTYYNNSTTASTTSGTRYYNNGNIVNPSFTLTQAAKSGWSARGWSTTNAGNASITYANGATITLTGNITLYGLYNQTITVTYYDNSTTAKTTTGTRYWAPAGYINPSFTLNQTNDPNWDERGWSTTNRGDASITYANGATFTRDSNITLYGLYSQGITLTYYDSTYSAQTKTGTRYWAPAGYINPSFTMTQTAISGWTALGWTTTYTAPDNAVVYSNGANITIEANTTIYGRYSQTITLSYSGNGATGGSTAAQTGTRHYNAPNRYGSVTFTLRSNGFTKTNHTFSKWASGSTSGTQYAAGASVTLSSSTTFYAIWEPNTLVVFEQVNTSRDGGTVTTYNRNYVNMTNTRCAAWIWYSLGSESQTETININYGNYKTATINYWMDTNNTDVFWEGDRRADFHIDGLGVFSSTDWDKTAPYTYSHTISKPSVQLRVDVENSDWDGTWVEGFLYPTKITLNK